MCILLVMGNGEWQRIVSDVELRIVTVLCSAEVLTISLSNMWCGVEVLSSDVVWCGVVFTEDHGKNPDRAIRDGFGKV